MFAASAAAATGRGRRHCAVFAAVAVDVAIESGTHTLRDGMRLELLHASPPRGAARPGAPPLLFVHGSYHGAWCWREQFMPYFAAAGFDCYAISLRGQGGSERGQLKLSGTLQSHADDLASVIATLPTPPVLVGHSFGGMLAEKYVGQLGQQGLNRPPLAGLALLASVPPTGNASIIKRITLKSLRQSWRITLAFVFKSFVKSIDECRYTFFSEDIPEEDLQRYHAQLSNCSPLRLLDLREVGKEVPLPPMGAPLPAFVGVGDADFVVDVPAVEETAAWAGVAPTIWPRVAHDCMLDTRWHEVADSLRCWLETF